MEGDKIVCFGEILWDFFQSEKKLGGAPYNVANSLKKLGADVNLISRVGDDQLGKEIIKKLHYTTCLQCIKLLIMISD